MYPYSPLLLLSPNSPYVLHGFSLLMLCGCAPFANDVRYFLELAFKYQEPASRMALRPRLLRSGARDSPENGEPERIQNRRRKEDGSLPLTGSGDLAMIPLSELMDMIRPLTLSSLFDLERDSTMRRLGHNTEYTHGSTGIGKQLDTRVWELVQKEVMDWHDTWSTSGLRGGNLVFFTTFTLE